MVFFEFLDFATKTFYIIAFDTPIETVNNVKTLLLGGTISTTIITPSSPHFIGKSINVSADGRRLNVRSTANGVFLGQQLHNAGGVIIDGPINTAGYSWYKVDFSIGVDGWVAGGFVR